MEPINRRRAEILAREAVAMLRDSVPRDRVQELVQDALEKGYWAGLQDGLGVSGERQGS